MIPRNIFYERLEKHCQGCPDWADMCLRGHSPQSPTGCPLKKFPPVQGAQYDEDRGIVVAKLTTGCCG